jgi:hypothetical protein
MLCTVDRILTIVSSECAVGEQHGEAFFHVISFRNSYKTYILMNF